MHHPRICARITRILVSIALLSAAPVIAVDWPEATCPLSPNLLQNGDFMLKEVAGTLNYCTSSFTPLDVCYWQTNGGVGGGGSSMNRTARLCREPEGEGETRHARLHHAVHLADPQIRDPSFVTQEFATPLAPGTYQITVMVSSFSAYASDGQLGLMIGLTPEPLVSWYTDSSSHFLANPVHYSHTDQLAPMFAQVIYQSTSNEFAGAEWQTVTATFTVTQTNLKHIYLFPIKYGVFSKMTTKKVDVLNLTNVAMDYLTPPTNLCAIIPNSLAPNPLVTVDAEGEPHVVSTGESIPLDGPADSPVLNQSDWDSGLYVHRMGDGNLHFDPLNPEQGVTAEDILAMFSFVNVQIDSIASFSGGHVWVTYSCDTCTLTADFNNDGDVNTLDLAIFLNANECIGGPGECLGDLNSDGVTNFSDLSVVLQQFGQSCGWVGGGAAPANDAVWSKWVATLAAVQAKKMTTAKSGKVAVSK